MELQEVVIDVGSYWEEHSEETEKRDNKTREYSENTEKSENTETQSFVCEYTVSILNSE